MWKNHSDFPAKRTNPHVDPFEMMLTVAITVSVADLSLVPNLLPRVCLPEEGNAQV